MNPQIKTTIINALRKAGYTGNQSNANIIHNHIISELNTDEFNTIEEAIAIHVDELDKVNPIGLTPAAFIPSHIIELNDWYSFKYF